MEQALIVAVESSAEVDRLASLAVGWTPVSVDVNTPSGELVAAIAEACGGWPERTVAVGDGLAGGRLLIAAIEGWLPVDGVAVAPTFDRLPIAARRRVPIVIAPRDDDGRTLVERLRAAGDPVDVGVDLGNALSRLLDRWF